MTGTTPLEFFPAEGTRIPSGALSHAVRFGDLIMLSATTPFTSDRDIVLNDFPAQMRQCMENLRAVLTNAGSDFAHVLKLEVQMLHLSDFTDMNRIFAEYFEPGHYPARATVVVKALVVPEFLVQIHGIAVVARPAGTRDPA
ncbi:2-iminobutanoate/2-iminopropanoate deaminase [Humitalea rosea]|uniref:2-iminobutanoate/2-iminopropanoate deaminase n=1 Tax=Humitalea rosea TaxID=990373 RepID=A0A2W7I5J5_9PROT|nr:RidA family protein [Humitalea rosea]PZW42151.1 2-iminobutanoate/2-iminopropanoate deaminase [Humitalea rosea]